MAGRWPHGARSRPGVSPGGLDPDRRPGEPPGEPEPPPGEPEPPPGEPGEPEPPGAPAEPEESLREIPRWMRLYFYGMHGVTLDVLLSSLRGVWTHGDARLVGFSSPYLCVAHSLSHWALEKVYERKRSFVGRPAVFHLVFYPSVYLGLQILIGNVGSAGTEQVRLVSCSQLLVHYVLALYFARLFHGWMSRLRYRTSGPPGPPGPGGGPGGGGGRRHLPGLARFLFFGMHGFLDEVAFTSAFNVAARRSPGGHTSLWSFLMYGSCSLAVEKLYVRLRFGRGWGPWRRLPVYVCVVYAWELSWGLALRRFGACSWDYSHHPHNFLGLITPLYLPGWVGLSLYQDVLSNVLMRVTSTGDAAPPHGDAEPPDGDAAPPDGDAGRR